MLADRVWLVPEASAADAPLKPGDGVVFDAADWRSPEEPEGRPRLSCHAAAQRCAGTDLWQRQRSTCAHPPRRPAVALARPRLDKAVRLYTEAAAPVHRQPVTVHTTAVEGAPLVTVWSLPATLT